jgi:hypothetical protein
MARLERLYSMTLSKHQNRTVEWSPYT